MQLSDGVVEELRAERSRAMARVKAIDELLGAGAGADDEEPEVAVPKTDPLFVREKLTEMLQGAKDGLSIDELVEGMKKFPADVVKGKAPLKTRIGFELYELKKRKMVRQGKGKKFYLMAG